MKRILYAVLALGALSLVIFAQNQSKNNDNIHPPIYSTGMAPRYEADRVIEMTLHEYDRLSGTLHDTTGRFTTFGIEMKYLGQAATIADGKDVSFFLTVFEWDSKKPDQIAPGNGPDRYTGAMAFENNMSAIIATNDQPNLIRWNRELREAKAKNQSFSGYAPGAMRGEIYDLRDSYCGFELFEHTEARRWHLGEPHDLTETAPQTIAEPFNRARIFGLPNDDGDYSLVAECEVKDLDTGRTYCEARFAFNDYIGKRVRFDGQHLCGLPKFLEAHQKFLEARVVAQDEFQRGIQ
ncbi:hypothetical protein [Pseudaestuariivita rosea]|uniref:hypothetical protein n=1 Tax=Pseudaestuariivita rosea TaxID=2763263 RepID=UPI001ABAF539|nr:hypothetical protein [Pseudaestuariivita rosea]